MSREERGLVLPLALLMLVVIGAVVAGGFATAMLEQRTGRNTLYLVQAAAAAEAGAAVSVGWQSQGLEALLPGEIAVLPQVRLSGGTTYQATVHRLNAELFELRVAGTRSDADGGVLARRELSVVLRQADSAATGEPPVAPLAHRAWSWLAP